MWILIAFDLPTLTARQRKAYTLFRTRLQQYGFNLFQYSFYLRHCFNEANMLSYRRKVRGILPGEGFVFMHSFSDRAFSSNSRLFFGRKEVPEQLPQPWKSLALFPEFTPEGEKRR